MNKTTKINPASDRTHDMPNLVHVINPIVWEGHKNMDVSPESTAKDVD